jgi:hypothetical protein
MHVVPCVSACMRPTQRTTAGTRVLVYRREEGREGHFSWLLSDAGRRWRK